MSGNRQSFVRGMRDGIPIALGYLAVAFTLGIAAVKAGLSPAASALMSATSVTSAGEFAGLGVIATGAALLEMAVTQLIINLRYCLMSAALSQKLDPKAPFRHRLLLAQGVTDEIFGISIAAEGFLNPFYTYGAMAVSLPGWTLGTWLGAMLGGVLPGRVLSAMSIALYAMFIAIILPPARKSRILAGLVAVSMALSLAAARMPRVRDITPGTRIILLTLLVAGAGAFLFPIRDEATQRQTRDGWDENPQPVGGDSVGGDSVGGNIRTAAGVGARAIHTAAGKDKAKSGLHAVNREVDRAI